MNKLNICKICGADNLVEDDMTERCHNCGNDLCETTKNESRLGTDNQTEIPVQNGIIIQEGMCKAISSIAATTFIISAILYLLIVCGNDVTNYFGIIILLIVLSSMIFTTLNWKMDIRGCYHGKTRLIKTRIFVLLIVGLLQVYNLLSLSDNKDAGLLGFIMLFSTVSFNSYFYGKKYKFFKLLELK